VVGVGVSNDRPLPQHLAPELVLDELGQHGAQRLRSLSALQILVLGVMAGAFISGGALFSVLLAEGVTTPGIERLLEGFGFSAGFFFVILSGAALFTEANVVMPATAVRDHGPSMAWLIARFWAIAWVGNLIGAVVMGWLIYLAQDYSTGFEALLNDVIERKLEYREAGGAGAWFRLVLSGVLANWLVGMAAFFATMGRTIIGKYIPVLLAVTLFVAANFQHSPANMAFFGLVEPAGAGPGWDVALAWNIIPAGIGNMIGGALLVVAPFLYAQRLSQTD
jgi:formate/nitrite transporter